MTSNYEVEIWAQSMDNVAEHEVFYRNFIGHWSVEHGRFFHIPKELVDF
jgi:hypothetical protein